MTKVVIIESDKAKIGFNQIKQGIINSFEGACNADGSFKQGWQPPGQWFVRKEGPGKYVVVHNQNRIDYAVSSSLLKNDVGTIKVRNMKDVSFDIEISRNEVPIDLPFRFHIGFRVIDG
jgi:hypothetical protein